MQAKQLSYLLAVLLLAGCIHRPAATPPDGSSETASPAQGAPMPPSSGPSYYDDDDEPEVISI